MTVTERIHSLLKMLAIAGMGAVLAQDEGSAKSSETFTAFGGIEVTGAAPFEGVADGVDRAVATGAIIFTAQTPVAQHPNIDLVGPDGYFRHFEITDSDEEIVGGLLPGIYSIAATEDGMQLAHTLVEVAPDRATRVSIDLAHEVASDTLGGEPVGDDGFVFPGAGYDVAQPEPFEHEELGAVTVETENQRATFVVTGPDGFSEEFEGAFTAEKLVPGLYVIAGTDEGIGIATSTVRVAAATSTRLVPVFDVFAETELVEEDVAGGGEAEQHEGAAGGAVGDDVVDGEAGGEAAEDDSER